MTKGLDTRSFSDQKHAHGRWNTATVKTDRGFIRAALCYVSQKRKGVDALAKSAVSPAVVFDAGAGKGAYGHWFLGRKEATIIAIDWSPSALHLIEAPATGRILSVCADLHFLPFKPAVADALYSIDSLGHVRDCALALDEMMRVCKPSAPLFIHSECCDYRSRWPDNALIEKLGRDMPAEQDGHLFLHSSEHLHTLYSRRFHVRSFTNPAGYFGWLLGYPEKYQPAFIAAGWKGAALLSGAFSAIKNLPVIGGLMRLINAFTNHAEFFFGLSGGGSCFAMLKKPDEDIKTSELGLNGLKNDRINPESKAFQILQSSNPKNPNSDN
jgi:SAM-dependent methyltransferase